MARSEFSLNASGVFGEELPAVFLLEEDGELFVKGGVEAFDEGGIFGGRELCEKGSDRGRV